MAVGFETAAFFLAFSCFMIIRYVRI